MDYIKLLIRVNDLVDKYFSGKTDNGGNDYKLHLESVAAAVEVANNFNTEEYSFNCYITAMLHDILEDTCCTVDELRENEIPEEAIEAIIAITRKDGESYFDFIKRVKQNRIAQLVKIYDLEHNMDIRRLNKIGKYELKRLNKYWNCWKYLNDKITEDECLTNINNIF